MNSQGVAIKFGILTAVILIVYFLFLGVLNLNSNPAFSFVNAAITAVGISLAIKTMRQKSKSHLRYATGFKTGFSTGAYATILFTIFFITYYSYNQEFAESLLSNVKLDMDTGLLFLAVAVMGFASTLVITLALMQLHKRKIHASKQ